MPQRIRAGCDDYTYVAYSDGVLCHSAFARVATILSRRHVKTENFATAHSRGLRRAYPCAVKVAAFFATAHSRGLRPKRTKTMSKISLFATAHSRGLRLVGVIWRFFKCALPQRIRAGCDHLFLAYLSRRKTLPQRIRAGCDSVLYLIYNVQTLCHSAFARVATWAFMCKLQRTHLCHSAFARVATGDAPLLCDTYKLCHSAFARVATAYKQFTAT